MTRSNEVSRILAEWIEARAAGDAPDPETLLSSHPDLAEALRAGLEGLGAIEIELAEADAQPSARAPEQIGDFRIVREIGRGGMGVVYEAEQMSMRRKVALKVLVPSLTGAGRAVKRFQREAHAAGQLHHTNIVPVFAMGQEQGYWFYAMELVEGLALDDVLHDLRKLAPRRRSRSGLETFASNRGDGGRATRRTTPVTTDDAWFRRIAEVFAGVAEGLQIAHDQRVVHRDVKPSNLLVDVDGTLKIVDFGLAHLDEPGPSMTITGDLVGTPAYMSPEQAMAKRVAVDHRTDIYSLGATLYEVITLRAPFDGRSLQELCSQIITKDPTLPRKLDEHIPRDLETIVLKAMEKDRDKRYARAADLADDLRRFATGHMIRARRVHVVERAWRKVKRHPRVATLVALLIVVGVIGAVIALSLRDEHHRRIDLEYARIVAEVQAHAGILGDRWNRSLSDDGFAATGTSGATSFAHVEGLLARAIEVRPERPEAYWLRVLFRGQIDSDPRADLADAIERGLPRSTGQLFSAYLDCADSEGRASVELSPEVGETTALDDYLRARIATHRGDLDAAHGLVDRSIERSRPVDITRFLALRWRMRLHVLDRDFAAALDDLHALGGLGYRGIQMQLDAADLTDAAGDPERARQILQDVLTRADRDTFQGQVHRAEALLELDRPDEALAIADALLADDAAGDFHHQVRHIRAQALTLQSRLEDARIELDRAIASRACAVCYLHRGGILMEQERFDEALADYEELLDRDPSISEAWFRKAVCLDHLGDWKSEDALRIYERVLARAPRWAKAHHWLGVALMKRARTKEAEQCFRTALGIDPDRVPTLRALGHLVAEHADGVDSRLDEAAALFERAIDLDPESWQALHHLGEVFARQGRREDALELLRQALAAATEPVETQLHAEFAAAMIATGSASEALDHLAPLLQEQPEDTHLLYARAWARMALGERDAAEQDLLRVLESEGPVRKPEAWHALGMIRSQRNDLPGAREAFAKAVGLQPDHPAWASSLASVQGALGEHDESLRTLEPHVESDALPALGWQSRVFALMRTGELRPAREVAREWTHARPDDYQAWTMLSVLSGDASLNPSREDLAECLAAARRAVEVFEGPGPHMPGQRPHVYLALALALNGHDEEAVETALDLLAGKRSPPPSESDADFLVANLEPWLGRCVADRKFELAAHGFERLFELVDAIPEPRRRPATWLHRAGHCHLMLGNAAASFRAYARALELDPKLDAYNAACAAIRASMMPTADLPSPAELRGRALAWMRIQWQRAREVAGTRDQPPPPLRPAYWQRDPDFEPVRDEIAMSLLPETECAAWQAFWEGVAAGTGAGAAVPIGAGEEQAYRDALAADPEDADAWNALGKVLDARGDREGACEAFARALNDRPEHPDALANLTRTLDRVEDARRLLTRLAEEHPTVSELWLRLIRTCRAAGDPEAACTAAQRWTELRPKDPVAWRTLAALCADLAADPDTWRPDTALSAARRAEQLTDGRDPAVLDVLAHALFVRGEAKAAIDTVLDALANPSSREANREVEAALLASHEELVQRCMEGEDFATALHGIERLIEVHGELYVNPSKHATWLHRAAYCHRRLEDFAASYDTFARAFALRPGLDRYHAVLTAIAWSAEADDVAEPSEPRARALEWLRIQFDRARELEKKNRRGPPTLQPERWSEDSDLDPVRDPDALAQLPDVERQEWQRFWDEVATWLRDTGRAPVETESVPR